MRILFILLALCSVAFAQVIDKNGTSGNGSLWANGKNPLLDRTARAQGDLVTILISESSAASFAASTNAEKKDDNTFSTNVLNTLFGLLNPAPTSAANSKTGGTGSTSQNGSLRARLTASVTHVLPNGNLVIEGSRVLTINKETQTFKLSGVIRRDDIAPDNSVLSESIAQAEIRFEGKGQIADRQRKGILTRILDWIF